MKILNPIDGTKQVQLLRDQSGHGINGNKGVLQTPHTWRLTNRCSLMLYPRTSPL